jgi:hypothetical protein
LVSLPPAEFEALDATPTRDDHIHDHDQRSPRLSCSRTWMNQPTYSTIANSSCEGGAPDTIGDQLGLEAVDEALGEGVVVGVADRPDGGERAVVGQCLCVVDAGVLTRFKRSSQHRFGVEVNLIWWVDASREAARLAPPAMRVLFS